MSDACSEPAGAIKAIDKHSVHQICSGQVVLTLATAVKELVENSIDAGASNIDVKLKESGAELVEVSDNGKGVEEANFEGLTLKHHTSKLRDFSDLIHVETFGFRGEALSSLCALSDLSVLTCHESSQVGTKLVFDHKGHLVQQSPQPRQQGTTVSLQQLFYTLPVRHKEFQRNIKKEYTKMIHVLQSYCIISTGVRITCSNQNGQGKRSTVLSTSGSQSMRDNIGAIFGPKQLQSLLPFQQVSPSENIIEEYGLNNADLPKQLFTITGFVSRGDHGVGRSATDRQFFFINNRPCDPLKVTKLVNEVYHMYNRHQYPFVALNIAVASECVDVNVTPDKRQIFLQEEKLLLAILKTSLISMYEAGVNKISLNYTPMPSTNATSTTDLHQVIPSDDNRQDPGEAMEPLIQSPKSSLNLASLKAAFSSHHSSNSSKSSANSGPTQKTLQSFFKGPVKTPTSNSSVKSPMKPVKDLAKISSVGKSVLDGFRYGMKSCSDSDHEKDSVSTTAPDSQCSGLELSSPEPVTDMPSIKDETFEETSDSSQTVPEDPELKTVPCTSNEDATVSPDAKRARKENLHFPTDLKSNTFSNCTEGSSPCKVDAPVCLQRRTVPLQFSLQELEGRIRRIQDQKKQKAGEELQYRRFRAKINPGENQSAEEELRKEISPQKLHLTAVSENVLLENIEIFRKNGFEFLVDEDAQVMERVKLVSLPTSKNWTFGPTDIEELIFMLSDSPGVMCRPSRVRQMFASRACRKSVMIGTALSASEMKKLVVHMGEIEHPWNCMKEKPVTASFMGKVLLILKEGMFTKGLMDGTGLFTWAGGLKYEGDFVCNVPMGQGVYTWPDGSTYKGEVYNGIRHGTGTYKCAINGVSYRGQWDQGKRHGKGVVYYNQDKTSWYKGDWVKNNREGLGERCYQSGNVYSGEWKNNQRHGEGTMRWLTSGQRYVGMWQDGVQHGQGTQIWIRRWVDGSQYSQCNQYTGDFAHGQRHGQGMFYYAGGAIYEGEWKNNKKDGKGKFTFKDGHVFEGEFEDDQMMTPNWNGNRALTPLCGALQVKSSSDSSDFGSDMALNFECLLDKFPDRKHDTERKQVEFVLLRKDMELRSIYSFYSRLGHVHFKDNTFQMSRLQLWRLLKDCNIHHHNITLAQINRLIKEEAATEIQSPFTSIPLRRLLSCLVIVAYHIHKENMVAQQHVLAACLSKLLTDDILPNAKNVKGFLFGQPDLTLVSMNHMKRCWEIYQANCRVHSALGDDQTMICRHMLWMFKDLRLLDDKLTTARLLKVITAESRDPDNLSSCLNLEVTFLEFFEVLLGCAEVKCQRASQSLPECQSLSRSNAETRRDLPEIPAQDAPESQQDVKTEVIERPQSAESTEVHQTEGEDKQTRKLEAKDQTIHQFFKHFFFPAFEHHQLVTKTMMEDKLPEDPAALLLSNRSRQRED
ncbi:hypothetical protein INR49_013831 [Caranx melampygus]|nr:hypothetical protein INR49_013831 [Caranx melampygus]